MIPTSETFWYWPGNFPIAQMDRPCDVCKQIAEGDQHDQSEPVSA
ncbi:MAG: hypothetical protein Q4G45_10025 [Actinomycetia bacterium]|nr:hypothetical protein [Actinomycetes bacterium]